MELELINLELKFATKKLNPQINLPFIFLIQKYSFHDNPTWNINYSEQVNVVPTNGKGEQVKKEQVKHGIGIDKFGIDKFDVELELTKWN